MAGEFEIGVEVRGHDGACGKLSGVIIDPIAGALTHLVVTPPHHDGWGRLVPIELVESEGDPIELNSTKAEFQQLDNAEELQFVPASEESLGYTGGGAYSWPHYGVGLVGGMGAGSMGNFGYDPTPQPVLSDRIPTGEVEVRRGDQVHAVDGWIGSVKGLVVDPRDHHVTHVLLEEGHLWKHKQVAIPIGTTARIDDEIQVDLTKQQIEELPDISLSSGPEG
jgi:sporulation protein YlmC with PRC-barrel domain